ncbi:hypothetical protein ACP3V3_16855 [Vibrio sp. PNB22_3_1]
MNKLTVAMMAATLSVFSVPSYALLNLAAGQKDKIDHAFSGAAPNWLSGMQGVNTTRFHASLNLPTSCTSGDIGVTIKNSLFEDVGRIREMYEAAPAVLESLVSTEGLVYLGILFIEKSNPNLYQFMTESFDLGFESFSSGILSCEGLAESIMSSGAMDSLATAARVGAVEEVASGGSGFDGDMARYREHVEDLSSKGVKWFFGTDEGGALPVAGGETTAPIDVVSSSVKAGACINRGVEIDDCEETQELALPQVDVTQFSPYNQMLSVTFGEDVGEIERVALEILGEKSIRVCEGCDTSSVEGRGAQVFLDEHKVDIYEKLDAIYSLDPQVVSDEDYLAVSAPGSINVNYTHLRGLQVLQSQASLHQTYKAGLAFDVAYVRTMFALDELERTFAAVLLDGLTDKSGMTDEVELYRDLIRGERYRLERHYKERGYVAQLYAGKLLDVAVSGVR